MSLGVKLGIIALVLLLVVVGSAAAYFMVPSFGKLRNDVVTHKVKKERLQITIVERGALESAENNDIYCRVKARNMGSTTASTIKMVVDDGTHVKKGQVIVELDQSGLEEQLKTQNITVEKAKADWVAAEEALKITKEGNLTDIKAAETTLQLAKIDLDKYVNGDYVKTKKDYEGQLKSAESDVEQQRDRAAWAQRMLKKGYYTVSQSDAEQSKLQSLELTLANKQEALRVLDNETYGEKKRTTTDYASKVAQAERALTSVKAQALSKETRDNSDRLTKKSVYDQEVSKQKEIVLEIEKCVIKAPEDGMVVYYISDQNRFGVGAQQGIVAQGEPVREGQKLMQIPNLDRMVVNTKVHEALVSKIHGDVMGSDGSVEEKGMPARIKVDSYPDRLLNGHVTNVATVAAQQDWMSADVKVYKTMVAIEGKLPGLKPGMSAEVTILVDASDGPVMTMPVQAIVGTPAMGEKRLCYVMTPKGPVQKEIEVGLSNEKMAEVRSGLEEGDEVILNPKAVMDDKALAEAEARAREKSSSSTDSTWGKDGEKVAKKAGAPKADAAKGDKAKDGKAKDGKAKDGKGRGGDKAGGFQPTEEQRKRMQEFNDKMTKGTPQQRKELLESIPESFRDQVRQRYKSQGMEIAD
jgi:multidrug efflux pump subunit AcrA (membrane-fusion protein)